MEIDRDESGDVWMPTDQSEKRAIEKRAIEKAAKDANRNMTFELGVFSVGLGIIVAAVFALVVATSLFPVAPLRVAALFVPSLLLVLSGAYVLVDRTELSVKLAKWTVTLAFVGQALLTLNPINWVFSAVCLYLVWRTAGQAIEQLASRRALSRDRGSQPESLL